MKITCDKTFSLTTSLVMSGDILTFASARIQQSALLAVPSVECGLFA